MRLAYLNLIDSKTLKVTLPDLLVTYLKNKEVKFSRSIIVFCLMQLPESVAISLKWLQ
jgi:hypothetical protein